MAEFIVDASKFIGTGLAVLLVFYIAFRIKKSIVSLIIASIFWIVPLLNKDISSNRSFTILLFCVLSFAYFYKKIKTETDTPDKEENDSSNN